MNDSTIRMKAIYFVISDQVALSSNFISLLLRKLIQKDKILLDGNTKLYINSLVHRERFRLWQTLLSLFGKIDSSDYEMLYDYSQQCLVNETQPSIRILTEWVITKILLVRSKNMELGFDDLFGNLKTFSSKKVGYTSSWLTILTNLSPLLIYDKEKIAFLNGLLPVILSQILSSNFHIRTYVEAALLKLNKLLNDPYPDTNTGLNHPNVTENQTVQFLNKQIKSIISSNLKEFVLKIKFI